MNWRESINNHFKLLVMDLDGTLINKYGQISEPDHQALFEVHCQGIQVSICTGRVLSASLDVLKSLPLDKENIFFDGALVYDYLNRKQIYSHPIPSEIVKQACETALSDGIPLDLFSLTNYYASQESWRTQIRKEFFGIESNIVDFQTIWQKEKIIKAGIAIKSPDDESLIRSFIDKFKNQLNFTWSVTPAYPDYRFINIIDNGVSKGRAVTALTEHLGISPDEVMAIGDGANDLSLLSSAGFAVAMGNSPAELKSLADYVTSDVENNGVAHAIQKFIL